MRILYRYLAYGHGFRNGKKIFFVTKGWKFFEVFTFFNVVRLDEDEATRILEFWKENQ